MSPTTIPIPPRLAQRPIFRGMPTPFVFFVRDGVPDFTVIDPQKWAQCATKRLCGLCGVKLGRHVYFIGGPLSAGHGHYTDPPMHEDCARYALKVCPYLAMGKTNEKRKQADDVKEMPHVISGVPEKFGLLHALDFVVVRAGDGYVFHAEKILGVEWHTPKHS